MKQILFTSFLAICATPTSVAESRALSSCQAPEAYYDCANYGKDLEFGSCAAALQCIEDEGEDRRFLRDVKRILGKDDDCWPKNPNCCDFGFDYGLKIDEKQCKSDGKDFCLGNGFPGSVNIKCPTKKQVIWDGELDFAGAFRKAGSKMYKSENGLFCKEEGESASFASSGIVSGDEHDTSHFDLCWYKGATAKPDEPSEDCYDPDVTPGSCTNNGSYICDEMNGRTYYMMKMTSGADCSMKCVAQSDVDYLIDMGYECGRCAPDPRDGDVDGGDDGDDEEDDEEDEDEDMCPEEL